MNETDKIEFKELLKEGTVWKEKVEKFLEREISPNNAAWQEGNSILSGEIPFAIANLGKLFIEEKAPTPRDLLYWLQKITWASEKAERLYSKSRFSKFSEREAERGKSLKN
jgi:hypothetical protein